MISFLKRSTPLTMAVAYLVPLLFWSLSILRYLPDSVGFWSLGLGWLLMSIATLLVYLTWMEEESDSEVGEEVKREIREGSNEDLEPYQKRIEDLTQELSNARGQGLKNLQDKEMMVAELQKELGLVKEELTRREAVLENLVGGVARLHKEVGGLVERDKQRLSYDANSILRRSLQLAEQHSGAWSFSPEMSGPESSVDSYALDQRRLYQALNKENRGVIFLFSPKEEKLLYVSQATRALLGQNPDQFAKEFSRKIRSNDEWREGLKSKERLEMRMSLESSDAGQQTCDIQTARITKGLFKNKVIGVLSTGG